MKVQVNGIRLYVDVDGAGLVPDGPVMREKPTLVLVHGGPGADHSGYKPFFSALNDQAQIVWFDNRGDGRSDRGPREAWTLDQWADDLQGLCVALGIERPIVYGASFGGIVAMNWAIRHPEAPAGLILVSTTAVGGSHAEAKVAMCERLGGPEAAALARKRFIERDTSADVMAAWLRVVLPLYTRTPPDPDASVRQVHNRETTAWFNRPDGEAHRFDFRQGLANIRCPTLVLGGELDPMLPIECQRDIAAALPADRRSCHEFAGCGHGVITDRPLETLALLRSFIADCGRAAG